MVVTIKYCNIQVLTIKYCNNCAQLQLLQLLARGLSSMSYIGYVTTKQRLLLKDGVQGLLRGRGWQYSCNSVYIPPTAG
jgi:hypothetical protein